MAVPDLVFRKEPLAGPPWVLVFGEPDTPEGLATLYGQTALPAAVLDGAAGFVRPPAAAMAGDLVGTDLMLEGQGAYQVNVARGPVATHRGGWEIAMPVQSHMAAGHQQATQRAQGSAQRWQAGLPLPVSLEARHAATVRLAQPPMRSGHQSAWRTAMRPLRFVEQSADRSARHSLATRHQVAMSLSAWPISEHWREALRDTRAPLQVVHQSALHLAVERRERAISGQHLGVSMVDRYQGAMTPPPGRRPPVVPPEPEACYLPSTALVFTEAWTLRQDLIFVCERHTTPGRAPLVIPLLRVYMATHTLQALLLPTLERVPFEDVTLSIDADTPHWKLTASGPLALLDQLRGTGAPRQVRIMVDGLPWVFAIEGFGRSREPGLRRARITGRSVPALLGASKLPQQTWLNAAPATAQQLVLEALLNLGVDVDWQIPDWLVPAGAWSFTGKPLAAAVRIAEAAGAVLQSHPTEAKLRFLQRYPRMPWEWMDSATIPDVSMSSRAITLDDYELQEEPEWEAVYVYGTSQGVARRIKRTGTAGTLLAPMVTDDLITDQPVAVERGRSVLGAGGTRADLTMSMPILTGSSQMGTLPGVLRVNQLLEVVEPVETWRGLVRSVSVRASPEEVRQSLTVERHFFP